jgi:hypothetical protein
VEAAAEDVGSRWIVGLYQGQQLVPSSGSADCCIFYKDYGQCCKFDRHGELEDHTHQESRCKSMVEGSRS